MRRPIIINKIGVELEATILEDSNPTHPTDWKIVSDGSIHSNHSNGKAVEFVTKPLDTMGLIQTLRKIEKNVIEVNQSMGFHVHFSFKNPADYERLLSKRFFSYFVRKTKQWATKNDDKKLLARFNNHYCKTRTTKNIESVLQEQYRAESKNSCRYYALNFAKNQHGTLEIRLFPARKRGNYKYVRVARDIIEEWLTEKKYFEGIEEKITIEETQEAIYNV